VKVHIEKLKEEGRKSLDVLLGVAGIHQKRGRQAVRPSNRGEKRCGVFMASFLLAWSRLTPPLGNSQKGKAFAGKPSGKKILKKKKRPPPPQNAHA